MAKVEPVITKADRRGWRWMAGGLWWKLGHLVAHVGCVMRGYHLRRSGPYRRYCLQCGLADEHWRMGAKISEEDARTQARLKEVVTGGPAAQTADNP